MILEILATARLLCSIEMLLLTLPPISAMRSSQSHPFRRPRPHRASVAVRHRAALVVAVGHQGQASIPLPFVGAAMGAALSHHRSPREYVPSSLVLGGVLHDHEGEGK
jgi:hypothetical protein